jgi:hypothetical protein
MEPGIVVPQHPKHLVFTGAQGIAAHGGDEP